MKEAKDWWESLSFKDKLRWANDYKPDDYLIEKQISLLPEREIFAIYEHQKLKT